MYTHTTSLIDLADGLRTGGLDLHDYIDDTCDRVDAVDAYIESLVAEPGRQPGTRRDRLHAEADELLEDFPDPGDRPPLFGVLIGVKDIFHATGFVTQAGTQVPPFVFGGDMDDDAAAVTALRMAGALVLAKTVTTEFAYFEPGPTRNPHNLDHTPGGSSSGSAAAVAAGLCPLALGTQTVGSVIRPAAYCGIVGFKPTFDRIPSAGLIPFSPSADTVGLFTQSVADMALAASLVCHQWEDEAATTADRLPVLGVPDGPYLAQTEPDALAAFEAQLALLAAAGVEIRRVPALADIAQIDARHQAMIAAELAQVHARWFGRHSKHYRPRTAELIRFGQTITPTQLAAGRAGRKQLAAMMADTMGTAGIDLWICPAAPGPAPRGILSTGSPAMNLPWTHAGMPALTLPHFGPPAADALPLGLQLVAPVLEDETLLGLAQALSAKMATQ
jgi:Asp-tRNA(Asn)/Glu-tRNA(Gln) amidotransferase A subunit family amidase